MRLPSWDELRNDADQLSVLERDLDESLFVVGPPGSGKTSLAVRRAQMLARRRPCRLITYNRMLRRLMHLLIRPSDADGNAPPHPIIPSTMDSLVGSDWRQRMEEDLPDYPSRLDDWDSRLDRLTAISSDGSHDIVVDEGQDLPRWFFRYATHVGVTCTVFADEDQALRPDATTLEAIKEEAGFPNPFILQRNHRNTPEIARLAEHFHSGRLPAAVVMRTNSDHTPRLLRSGNPLTTAEWVARWFRNRGGSVGVIVDRRGSASALLEAIAERLPGTPVKTYTHEDRNEDEIDVTAPGVTILNAESAKGQEFDAVFLTELERFLPCRSDADRRRMYMLCSRARDHLFLVQGDSRPLPAIEAALPGPETVLRR